MLAFLGALGQLLPVGLAAALSTVPITVLLAIMLSPRRGSAALPFVLGCVLGTALVVVAAYFLGQLLPAPRPRQAKLAIAVLELLFGSALVALGIRAWRRRHRSTPGLRLPGWASSALDSVSGAKAFGLGVIIEFRPKSALLACIVGLQLHTAGREPGPLVMTVIYVAIATSTVTVPVLLTALMPERMEPRLKSASESLASEGSLISAIVLWMVGAVVIGSGLQDLL